MTAREYERTDLTKARTSLAFARNRVTRLRNQALEAAREVGVIEKRIAELEQAEKFPSGT
jgi:hypothetical protein